MRRPSKDLALKFLNEAEEFLSKGDLVQACEKYYKAAEEAIKLLVIENNLKEIIN
ncbi:PaREP1 family protein, partial [Saccharolobus solfataricus]